jgi:hypothetical protein
MYCVHCGASLPQLSNYCRDCGKPTNELGSDTRSGQQGLTPSPTELDASRLAANKLSSSSSDDQERQPDSEESTALEERFLHAAIKTNLSYYIPQFRDPPDIRFNWAAFFWIFGWYAYRKLYGYAFLLMALWAGIPVVASMLVQTPEEAAAAVPLMITADVVLRIFFAGKANELLRNKLLDLNEFARHALSSDVDRLRYAQVKGGPTVVGVVVFLLIATIPNAVMLSALDTMFSRF